MAVRYLRAEYTAERENATRIRRATYHPTLPPWTWFHFNMGDTWACTSVRSQRFYDMDGQDELGHAAKDGGVLILA